MEFDRELITYAAVCIGIHKNVKKMHTRVNELRRGTQCVLYIVEIYSAGLYIIIV